MLSAERERLAEEREREREKKRGLIAVAHGVRIICKYI